MLTSEILNEYSGISFETNTHIWQQNVAAFQDLMHLVKNWNQQEKIKYDKKYRHLETPVENLEALIIDHIFATEQSEKLSEKDKLIIRNKFDKAMKLYRHHENYKMMLVKTLEVPPEILQMEILNNSEQRLEQQLRDILQNSAD